MAPFAFNDFVDRLLHRRRRRRLAHRLRRAPPPRSLLFLCNGNLCRSPFAAAIARRMLPEGVRVESAGFLFAGRASPASALAAARQHGCDLAGHRSRAVSRRALEGADLIVVMDGDQQHQVTRNAPQFAARVIVLGDVDPDAATQRGICDPIDQSDAIFQATYERIERCVSSLVNLLGYGSTETSLG